MIERIKEIKLLRTLKGTDEKGKPIVWLAGTVFKPKEKPLPQSIIRELNEKRKGGSILEVFHNPLPKVKEPEELVDSPETSPKNQALEDSEDTPDVSPKKKKVALKKRK